MKEMKIEIPQWVIEYNNANHQSSAGKAIKILMEENERMAELLKEQIELVSTREAEQDVMATDTVRLMDQIEYQKKALKEDYDKITKLEFELKEERNKAIQECITAMLNDQDILFNGSDILEKLESFKR